MTNKTPTRSVNSTSYISFLDALIHDPSSEILNMCVFNLRFKFRRNPTVNEPVAPIFPRLRSNRRTKPGSLVSLVLTLSTLCDSFFSNKALIPIVGRNPTNRFLERNHESRTTPTRPRQRVMIP